MNQGSCIEVMSMDDFRKIAIALSSLFGDPELVLYFMKIYIPMANMFLTEDSRSYHMSLRMKPRDRWARLQEICHKRESTDLRIYAPVPITFPLPINGERWRCQKKCMDNIIFFSGSFIRKYVEIPGTLITPSTIATIRDKIRVINMVNSPCKTENYKEMREAVLDYNLFEDDTDPTLICHVCIYELPDHDIINYAYPTFDVINYEIIN